jgi:hypothetical protein
VKNMLAWHMGGETLGYGDGRRVRVGERLDVPDADRAIRCCEYGMHGCSDPLDMLALATGDWIRRVCLHDVRDRNPDKAAAPGRTTLWELTPAQGRAVVVAFAQWCAKRAKRYAADAYAATAATRAATDAADATAAGAYAAAAYAADAACAARVTAARATADAYAAAERKAQARKLTTMLNAAHRASGGGK